MTTGQEGSSNNNLPPVNCESTLEGTQSIDHITSLSERRLMASQSLEKNQPFDQLVLK